MKKLSRILAFIGAILIGYYAYQMAELYFYQEKRIFYPEKEWKATPAQINLAFEDLTLTASDGVKLSAWFIPAQMSRGSVIFLHGNARNISAELEAIGMFHDFGYHVLILDYRGYGRSEGSPTEAGLYRDAQAAWDWLVNAQKEQPDRIVICGRSLGATIAANLASKNSPRALILEAAFTNLPDVGQAMYPYFPVKLLSRYRFDTRQKLMDVRCPTLIVNRTPSTGEAIEQVLML